MTLEIRPAAPADEAAWRGLWAAYLAFYKADVSDAQTARTWSRILDPDHAIGCLIAADGDTVLGYAVYLTHPSTWLDVGDCYLEDLYVAEAARGRGVGRRLIESLRDRATEMGCERLYWNTDHDNTRARALYDSLTGGEDGHVRYRMLLKR